MTIKMTTQVIETELDDEVREVVTQVPTYESVQDGMYRVHYYPDHLVIVLQNGSGGTLCWRTYPATGRIDTWVVDTSAPTTDAEDTCVSVEEYHGVPSDLDSIMALFRATIG